MLLPWAAHPQCLQRLYHGRFTGLSPLAHAADRELLVQGTPACKSIGGLLCLAIPLGVCDAESDHVTLSQW